MDNYLIRYDNCINSVFPTDLTKLEMNAFAYILASFRNNSSTGIRISYKSIREAIRYNPRRTLADFDEELARLCTKLQKITIAVGNDKEDCDYMLFPTFIRNWYDQVLTVEVNDRTRSLFDVPRGYTTFDIREFISLKHKASKFIFINLKQFRTTGIWHVGINEFKRRLGVISYSNNNCLQKLIIPAVKELNEKGIFKDLSFKSECDSLRGNPICALLFRFTPEQRANHTPDKGSEHSLRVNPDHPNDKNAENGVFRSEKRENVPLALRKSENEKSDIVVDSMFCTAEALLGGMLSCDNIDRIAKEANRAGMSPFMLKCCINNVLGRDNISNPVGYIITLIRKNSKGAGSHSFYNPNERVIDYGALERELLGKI